MIEPDSQTLEQVEQGFTSEPVVVTGLPRRHETPPIM